MNTPGIPNLLDVIEPTSIHVYAPTKVVMLCGGGYNIKDNVDGKKVPPKSLRDAFYRAAVSDPFRAYTILMPDEIKFHPPLGPYDELLEFESDFAQLCELVILFTESEGSFAELGAFAMVPDIAPKLLVFIDDKNYADSSFIKLGPVFTLKKHHGTKSVFVVRRKDIEIESIRNVRDVNIEKFKRVLSPPFTQRAEQITQPTTLNPERRGHIAKLIAGLIHHFGALTSVEIAASLGALGVSITKDKVDQLTFCLTEVGWIAKEEIGFESYYAYATAKAPFNFHLKPNVDVPSGRIWRAQIRDYWRENQADRFEAISSGMGRTVDA